MKDFANAGLSRDFPEPDDSDEDAIDAEVERRLEDADHIADALYDGLRKQDGVSALAAKIATYAKARNSENCYRAGAELLATLGNAIERDLRAGL